MCPETIAIVKSLPLLNLNKLKWNWLCLLWCDEWNLPTSCCLWKEMRRH